MKKGGLGRGLSALIPEKAVSEKGPAEEKEGVVQLELDRIKTSEFQPRRVVDPEKLEELKASIRARGLVQPVLVRAKDEGYELICGERRLKAVQALGMQTIPAIVRQARDEEALELSLIENLQREDLNPIEQAQAYKRLLDEFDLTQDELAKVLGKDRSSVSNTIRLLNLPQSVQDRLSEGKISMGHAIAILSLDSPPAQIKLCEKIVAGGLSVRATERLVRKKALAKKMVKQDPEIIALEEELQRILSTKVRIRPRKKGGMLEIEYYTDEDLERILGLFRK